MLRSLTQYENPDAVPFGYAHKPLGFTLVLWHDGKGCHLLAHHDEKGRGAPERAIPNLSRTVMPIPLIGCDTAAYVLGLPKQVTGGPEAVAAETVKTKTKHALFVGLLNELHEGSSEELVASYLQWVEAGMPGVSEAIEGLSPPLRKRLDMDPIAIAREDLALAIHELPTAQKLWSERVREGKADGPTTLCLVCGQTAPTVATLPQSLIGRLVPGATQANVALASVNFASASRGASGTGLRSAPICADCGSKAVQNFNALASSTKHAWRSMANDVGLIWWTTQPQADDLIVVAIHAKPEEVASLIAAPTEGTTSPARQLNEGHFFAMTYSGNVARLVVRRWVDLPLREIHSHILAWFHDVASPNPDRRHYPMWKYAEALGTLHFEQGSWRTPSPAGAVEALLMAALAGAGVPPNFLALALARASAEMRMTNSEDGIQAGLARRRMEARVGLLRLILNRTTSKENPMTSYLDESRDDSAYLSGRVFAVRESLQRLAMPNVNASIVDKFYERASGNPASVEHSLDVLSKQHLRALARDEQLGGARFRIEKQMDELLVRRGDAPGRLTLDQQAAWLCGYYQEKHAGFTAAKAAKEAKQASKAQAQETLPTNDEN